MRSSALSHQEVIAWYSGADGSPAEISAKAYEDAVAYFENELSKDDSKQVAWVRSHTSMSDVLNVVKQAQNRYSDRSEKNARARKWASSFASVISYFGGVLDLLAQADPLHAGLAWGAMKFVLLGVIGHDRMVGDLCKALTKIAEVLPRVQLDSMLYNTPRMAEAVAKLYAHILFFLREAVNWYQHSPIRRTFHGLVRPLLFQDTISNITDCTKIVDDIACAASRAEIRGLSLMNASLQQQLQQLAQALLQQESTSMRQFSVISSHIDGKLDDITVRTDQALQSILQVATNNHTLSHSIKVNTTNIQGELLDRQYERAVELLSPKVDPDEVLRVCSALSRRYQPLLNGRDVNLISRQIQEWANTPQSCMLLMRALPRAEAKSKDIALQIVRFLKLATEIPVFWYFSHPTIEKGTDFQEILCMIFKNLTYQALRRNGTLFTEDAMLRNTTNAFSETKNISTWLNLMERIFSRIKAFFIVLETDDLYRSFGYDSVGIRQIHDILKDLYDRLSKSSGSTIKLLVITRGSIQQLLDCGKTAGDPPMVVNVDSPLPVASRLKASQTLRLNLASRRGPSR